MEEMTISPLMVAVEMVTGVDGGGNGDWSGW